MLVVSDTYLSEEPTAYRDIGISSVLQCSFGKKGNWEDALPHVEEDSHDAVGNAHARRKLGQAASKQQRLVVKFRWLFFFFSGIEWLLWDLISAQVGSETKANEPNSREKRGPGNLCERSIGDVLLLAIAVQVFCISEVNARPK